MTSRRDLKTYASGIAHKFSCSAQHYAWLAHHYGISRVNIDLFTLSINPPEFDIERNRILAEQCRENLLYLLKSLTTPASVNSALLFAEFGFHDYSKNGRFVATVGESTFSVILTDDRGKEWVGVQKDERILVLD